MPRIMTVDDSRAVRAIVSKELISQSFEVDEAEDGQQALDKLEEIEVDLILLDVTMPVMDGPTMLAKLREGGRKTPVIMLTSEAKRSIVAEAMKLGIEDYILKPFKPAELLKKVRTALKLDGPSAAVGVGVAAVAPAGASDPVEATAGKQFIDVLVIDDMDNVAKRLRQLIPAHLTLNSQLSAQSALLACRERVFRTILIDVSIPDIDSGVLASQLKLLQPHAAFVCLSLRTSNNLGAELKAQGFSDVLYKPFTPESVEDFVMQYFDTQELIVRDDNLVTVAAFVGKEERVDRYYQRLRSLLIPAMEQIASACYEEVILDLSGLPPRQDRAPKLLLDLNESARSVGLSMRLVGPAPLGKILSTFEETRDLKVYPSIDLARAAA